MRDLCRKTERTKPMSQSQLKESFLLLGKEGQSFKDYHAQEIERCEAQLKQALETAAKDHTGKPVFYTILRHVSKSGMSRTISVHYVEAESGRILHLNYVAAVLLDRSMDRNRDGVVCKGCGMDMGYDLIHSLGHRATGDGYSIHHQWL